MTESNLGILAQLEAKPDKVKEVKDFLTSALPLAVAETGTNTWFAVQVNSTTFAIFDTFSNENSRQAHLEGEIAKALMEQAENLLASSPSIEKVDILAAKVP